ncbi:MAG: hypothetical protein DMF89_25520 [Acidobacteria bacterium]|nr:MAG: hypothetical protein DMF90_10930 [Acidobacteriota bacterium]PYR45246.1 MAG: hypothetical protein DMF89_25520 [Acidobacteriota bacterium]
MDQAQRSWRSIAPHFNRLADRYRVIVIEYPPRDKTQAFVDSFTADHVCADILAVANAASADRFAWFGFSWGGVVGCSSPPERIG